MSGYIYSASQDDIVNTVILESRNGLLFSIPDFESGNVYKISSDATGVKVSEYNPNLKPRIDLPGLAPDMPANVSSLKNAAPALTSGMKTSPETTPETTVAVDVLVVYDKLGEAWANSEGDGITNFAAIAVTKMNTALSNSGVDADFTFRLVGAEVVGTKPTKTDSGEILEEVLTNVKNGTGDYAPVKKMRDEFGADIVCVLTDTGSPYGYVGLGYALDDKYYSDLTHFADYAYNVSSIQSVNLSHTMTHEVGHNMGAGHSDKQTADPGPQLYDYSAGYYFYGMNGKGFHTIMAYDDDGHGNVYFECPYFSTPLKEFRGTIAGTETNDNARTLTDTCLLVSEFKETKIDDPIPLGPFWKYITENDEVKIIKAPADIIGDIVVPDSFENLPVTAIGSGAFSELTYVTSLTLPATVTSIEDSAFENLDLVGTINIPAIVTNIGARAFMNCESITNLVIPTGVKVINDRTFSGCVNLKDLVLPANIESIGAGAFEYCSSLPEFIMTDTVTSLGDSAFYGCSGMTNIVLSATLTDLPSYTLKYCSALVKIRIPGSISKIGRESVSECSELTDAYIEDGVEVIGERAFANDTKLKNLRLPKGLKNIGEQAFYNCSSLTKVNVPEGTTVIGAGAFENCQNLTECMLPSTVEIIGENIFKNSGINTIQFADGARSIPAKAFMNTVTLLTTELPDTITTIGARSFSGCVNLTTVTLPEGLTNIGSDAVADGVNLESVTIPKGVTYTQAGIFSDCANLKEIVVWEGAESNSSFFKISDFVSGNNLVNNNASIRYYVDYANNIGWDASVTDDKATIINTHEDGKSAISAYTEGDVVIPDTINGAPVTAIGDSAFKDCDKITSITIPDSVETIAPNAFEGCDGLTTVIIPDDPLFDEEALRAQLPDTVTIIKKSDVVTEFKEFDEISDGGTMVSLSDKEAEWLNGIVTDTGITKEALEEAIKNGDGDDLSLHKEYLLNTDPTEDTTSLLKVTGISVNGTDVTIEVTLVREESGAAINPAINGTLKLYGSNDLTNYSEIVSLTFTNDAFSAGNTAETTVTNAAYKFFKAVIE